METGANSTTKTAHRNTCMYWVAFMSGSLVGNLYVFYAWAGVTEITESLQHSIAIITGTLSLVGSFIFLFLRPLPQDFIIPSEDVSRTELAMDYFKSTANVIRDWQVQYIIPIAIMLALENAYFSNIYPTCIGTSKGNGSHHV